MIYLGTPGVGLRGIYGRSSPRSAATPRFHHAALIPQAQELLAAESAERGKQVVLIIDEAHLLDAESLEGCAACRTSGWTRPPRSACCCSASRRCAAGCGRARSPRWISGSRCATRSAAWTAKETDSYVQHHLALAGRSDTLFSDDAIALIHEVSRGLPRQVNNLAVASLIAAFAAKKAIVDESAARAAVAEISAE